MPLGFVTVFCALTWVHAPLVRADRLLDRDDRSLVVPLKRLTSLADYIDAVRAGRILDLQPVRDLSFVIDLALGSATGLRTFHLTNLLLWFAIVLIAYGILCEQRGPSLLVFGCLSMFALHPVFVNSVGWVAARKHLLATLFILAATWIILRGPGRALGWRRTAMVALLYGLSIGSQPITVLWPFWASLHLGLLGPTRRGDAIRILVVCAPLLLLAVTANLLYYQGGFVQQTGAQKFVEAEGTMGVGFLALGRYFGNLIAPVALATQYYPGSILNVVGLLGLVLFAAATLKWRPRADAVRWLAFFLLPLLVVTVRMTTIFVSDTYLLVPAVGMLCLGALWLPAQTTPGRSKVLAGALGGLVAGYFVLSTRQAMTWVSEPALWAHAARVEPTPNALAKHAFYLAQEGRTQEAIETALRLGDWAPEHPEYPLVLSKAVFLDRSLTVDAKIRLLASRRLDGPWPNYYLASLLTAQGRYLEAHLKLRAALVAPETFKGELGIVAAEAQVVCQRARKMDCLEFSDSLRRRPGLDWSEPGFRLRLSALGP